MTVLLTSLRKRRTRVWTPPIRKAAASNRERLTLLIGKMERKLQIAFYTAVDNVKNEISLGTLADLIESGRIEEAHEISKQVCMRFVDDVTDVYIAGGKDSAKYLSNALNVTVNFDQTNYRAVAQMQSNKLRLIQEFTRRQREATNSALLDGVKRGLNPRAQARAFRDSIGLTNYQENAVQNYRRMLEGGPDGPYAGSLNRELRDHRFDRSVRRAGLSGAEGGEPLSPATIDKMVGRYRERYIKYRSEVIARTESLGVVHQGSDELFQQAIDDGKIEASELINKWFTGQDERVRGSHAAMHGQTRIHGESFESGSGILLSYPGDPNAPAEERIQCRCAVSTRVRRKAVPKKRSKRR